MFRLLEIMKAEETKKKKFFLTNNSQFLHTWSRGILIETFHIWKEKHFKSRSMTFTETSRALSTFDFMDFHLFVKFYLKIAARGRPLHGRPTVFHHLGRL